MAAFTAWLGLSGASIGGVPSEPVGGGYFRVNATGDLTGSAFTIPALTFGPALTRWGTLMQVVAFDAQSGGSLLFVMSASAPLSPKPGQLVTVAAGSYAVQTATAPASAVLTIGGSPVLIGGQALTIGG